MLTKLKVSLQYYLYKELYRLESVMTDISTNVSKRHKTHTHTKVEKCQPNSILK